MAQINNDQYRYGRARFAFLHELRRAGMLQQKSDSLFVGFHKRKPLWYRQPGGILCLAAARAGKLRDLIAFNICSGVYTGTMLILDPKGELAAISQNQTADKKAVIRWNPAGLHGLSGARINPVSNLNIWNPNLVSDAKAFTENVIASSGSASAQFFESRARMYLEALILGLVERDAVLTLPALYQGVLQMIGNGDAWIKGAGFDLADSQFVSAQSVEEELDRARRSGNETGGLQGTLAELARAFAPLSDPRLMASVSPPFDFSLEELTSDHQATQFYMMVPAEYVSAWSGVTKAMLVNAMLYKSRAPLAPRQVWLLDEAAQACKGMELLTQLYTYGAGIGITPFSVFQSWDQLKLISPGAETIIPASAQLKIMFALRELSSATTVSRMMGTQSLAYDDGLQQSRASHAKKQAIFDILNGADPVEASLRARHQAHSAVHKSVQSRDLMTPSEVMGLPGDKMLLFMDGLSHPVLADRKPYWTVPWMAGRYHPNPYHPPSDRVVVQTRFGKRTRWVCQGPVPSEFAHLPQYADGQWSFIAKRKPTPRHSHSQRAGTTSHAALQPMWKPAGLLPPPKNAQR